MPLRCLIADIPQKVLADILERVTEEAEEIKVVGQVPSPKEVVEVLQMQPIDVLILGMRGKEAFSLCNDLLEVFPGLLIIGLMDDGRLAVIYLDDVSSYEIVSIIDVVGRYRKGSGKNA